MWSKVTVLLLWILIAAVSRAADTPEPLATPEQLHQLFKDKDYSSVLQKLNRILQLRGDAARPYDQVELELLKVDTHLALKQQSLAISAAEAAVKAIEERTPPREAAVAQVTVAMLKRSRAWEYAPRNTAIGQQIKPISIIDPDLRPKVFAAMFDDAKGEILAKARRAKQSKTLGPVIEGVKAVAELRALELAAFGKDEQSAAKLDELAVNAHDIMAAAVKDMKDRRTKIDAAANELLPAHVDNVNNRPGDAPLFYKKGLLPQGRNDLKGIISDCDQIDSTAKQFAELSKSTESALDDLRKAAGQAANDAKTTLDADYGGVYTK